MKQKLFNCLSGMGLTATDSEMTEIINICKESAPNVEQELMKEHINMLEKRNMVFVEYVSSVEDFYTGIDPNDDVIVRRFKGIVELQRETEAQLAKLQAELAEAKELLKGARSDLDYLIMPKGNINADIRNDYVIDRKERIDEFLKGEK